MVLYKFMETGAEQDGISSAVWRELEKEVQRRDIYERASQRREQDEQRERLQKQLEIMKLLHPLEFTGTSATNGTAASSADDRQSSRGGNTRSWTVHDTAGSVQSSAMPYTDPYAAGDHRSNAGMNWDASGRIKGSPELSVPRNGCDEWVIAGDGQMTASGDREYCDLTMDTQHTPRQKLPAEALAALRVPPPEIHWPQTDAVRHILEEEDEHDAALFAHHISQTSKDEDGSMEDHSRPNAPVVVGNIETGLHKSNAEYFHHPLKMQYDTFDTISTSRVHNALNESASLSRARRVKFTDEYQNSESPSVNKSISVPRTIDNSTDTELDRSQAGERQNTATAVRPNSKKKSPDESKVLSRIERAVDLGLRLRRLTRMTQLEDEMNDH